MRLDTSTWQEFQVQDIFNVVYGVNLELNACEETTKDDPEAINFVSRSRENNGVTAYIKPIEGVQPQEEGIITVAGGGSSVLSTFVQYEPFYSGRDLYLLIPLPEYSFISLEMKLFICTSIMANKYKYSFGRQANKTLPTLVIKLPVLYDGSPDWQYMEDYIKSLNHKVITTKNSENDIPKLDVKEWGDFKVGDIFPKIKCVHHSSVPDVEGDCPFVSSSSTNNGVSSYVDAEMVDGNCITVSTNGDCFDCFYHEDSVAISNDVEALYNDNLNQYNAMFICAVMMQEKPKWSYGRKPKNDKVYETIIKLPKDSNGQVDWIYMENYIKSLPYGDRI